MFNLVKLIIAGCLVSVFALLPYADSYAASESDAVALRGRVVGPQRGSVEGPENRMNRRYDRQDYRYDRRDNRYDMDDDDMDDVEDDEMDHDRRLYNQRGTYQRGVRGRY